MNLNLKFHHKERIKHKEEKTTLTRVCSVVPAKALFLCDLCAPCGKSTTRRGFSILELATVLAILILIIGASTGAFLGWQHAAAIRGAEDQVTAALSHARQYAIANRTTTGLAMGLTNAPGYPSRVFCVAFTNDSDVASSLTLDFDRRVHVSKVAFLPLRTTVSVTNYWPDSGGDGPFVVGFLPDGRTQPDLDSDPVLVVVGVTRGSEAKGTETRRTIRLDPLTGIPHNRPEAKP